MRQCLRMFQGYKMRCLFWFLPAVVIPLAFHIISSGQPSSTATVNIRSTPTQPLPPLALSPEITPVALTVITNSLPTLEKKQSQKVIAQKRLPKTQAQSSKSKANTRPYSAPAIEIRVAIAQNASNIAAIAQARTQGFASSTEANITDSSGQVLGRLPPSQAVQVNVSDSTILFQNWQVPSSLWIEPSDGGAVFVGNSWYRGKLLLVAQGNKLLAINYVNLEQYLLSVVGSEMSAAAPIEALKAQAVATRSYALVHTFGPANQWFDVTAGERHQAYKGIATDYSCSASRSEECDGAERPQEVRSRCGRLNNKVFNPPLSCSRY